MRSYTIKENHIVTAVSEILRCRQTEILLLYYKELNVIHLSFQTHETQFIRSSSGKRRDRVKDHHCVKKLKTLKMVITAPCQIVREWEMPWPKISVIRYHAQLGLPNNGRAIQELVVCWVLPYLIFIVIHTHNMFKLAWTV